MHILFDNLSATIIGGIILLMLIIMQQRLREVSTEQVMTYSANQHAIDLGTWMQEDMVNIGWKVTAGNGIVSVLANDTLPDLTKWFEFDGLDDSDPSISTRIQYQLIPALDGSGNQVYTSIDGTSVPLWEVQRLVGGSVTGQSAPLVTFFSIDVLDANGITAAPTAAEQVRIRFSMGMPFGKNSFLREAHWNTSFFISP